MSDTRMLRVFTDATGNFGDAASVVVDEGRHIPDNKRQSMARELHTSETAFINNVANAEISIMHYQGEVDFAGTLALAASYVLTQLQGSPVTLMHGRKGEITTWRDGDVTWVRASLATMPPWNYRQLDRPEAVEGIRLEDTKDWQHTMAWAWVDEARGLIRARTFAPDWEIPEAQGNGSGSMVLAAKLNRSIEVRHGEGSVIFAKPAQGGYADIGGRVSKVSGEAPIYTIAVPQYQVTAEPDYKAVGKVVDDELRKHFMGRTIVARGIGSSEHLGKTIDELAEIIARDGTDRYDPNRKGDRYENIQGRHIDLFGFRRKVTPRMQLFRDVVYGFYQSAIGIHGKPTRIDVLVIYDAAKLKSVLHQYEGREDKKRDGFVFTRPEHKQDALLAIVKVL